MVETQMTEILSGTMEISPGWCKGCNLCASVCVRGAITLDNFGKARLDKPEKCTGCGMCEAICPDYAISVKKYA